MSLFSVFLRYNVHMVQVISQGGESAWLIEWFKLRESEAIEGWWEMIGMARISLEETQIVSLGSYKYWKQAIDVFARLDYEANDLMYYRQRQKLFQMPDAIVDEQVCLQVYGSLY